MKEKLKKLAKKIEEKADRLEKETDDNTPLSNMLNLGQAVAYRECAQEILRILLKEELE